MQEKAVALGLEIANDLEALYNALNDNQPVDPRFRHLVSQDILEKVAQFRSSLADVEVEMPEETAEEGEQTHTLTQEDMDLNPGLEEVAKVGDEVILPPAGAAEGQESSQEAGKPEETATDTPKEDEGAGSEE